LKTTEIYFAELKARGLSPERQKRLAAELRSQGEHFVPAREPAAGGHPSFDLREAIYGQHDMAMLEGVSAALGQPHLCMRTLDELLERDRRREEDGFPRKIQVGRLIKPGRGGKDKIVVVPTTVEEKLIHDSIRTEQESESGGTGDGAEGEVIGEQPVREPGEAAAAAPVREGATPTKWSQVPTTWGRS